MQRPTSAATVQVSGNDRDDTQQGDGFRKRSTHRAASLARSQHFSDSISNNPHATSLYAVIASASEAIHRATAKKEWIASSLPLLAMTQIQTLAGRTGRALEAGQEFVCP
jgi:hypothetical protein